MPPTKARACDGKTPYTKAEAVEQELVARNKRFARVRRYKCKHCGHWHLGHYARPRVRR